MPADAREHVKDMLLDHRGKGNEITSREISDQLEKDEVGSFPSTRMMVRDIMMEDEIPIGSNTNGYYVIETDEELDEYVANLESRMSGIADRRFAVLKAAGEWDDDLEVFDDRDLL